MFYVYAIGSVAHNRIYVGMTGDVARRLAQHNAGHNTSTKAYRPWVLFHEEVFESRLEARAREIRLKSGFGKEFLRGIWQKAQGNAFKDRRDRIF